MDVAIAEAVIALKAVHLPRDPLAKNRFSPDSPAVNKLVVKNYCAWKPRNLSLISDVPIIRDYRKPLVVASPKLILRMQAATSSISEMTENTFFKTVLEDTSSSAADVTKMIFCSGKHYYALDKERRNQNITNTAIIRIEELVPFPAERLKEELKKYPNAKDFLWCQEEHRNMGAWSFVNPRFQNILNLKLKYCGRDVLGTPAVGIGSRHSEDAAKESYSNGVFLLATNKSKMIMKLDLSDSSNDVRSRFVREFDGLFVV
eukprot:gene2590-784_t